MCIAEMMRTVTRQRIFISWRCIFAVEPSLIPVFGMTQQDNKGEDDAPSVLNRDAPKFQTKAIGALVLPVQIKVFFKQLYGRLLLKIHLTEYLEVTNVGNRIGSEVLRMEFKK